MEEIDLRFEFEEGVDLEVAAQTITERLAKWEIVEAVGALPEEAQVTGIEIVAIVVATIALTRHASTEIKELRKLVTEIKGLLGDLGIKRFTARAGKETASS